MEQVHKDYLDALRRSGVVNMFGAGVYLQAEFGVNKQRAQAILTKWMKTFNKEDK